jgi:hypothetical protein
MCDDSVSAGTLEGKNVFYPTTCAHFSEMDCAKE